MKIIFAGTPEPAAVTLQHLLADERLEVTAVITQPDAKKGRGRMLRPSAVAEVAAKHDLPIYKWSTLKDSTEDGQDARNQLADLADSGVQAIAVVAYGNLIPADLLDVVQHGWVNLHFSLLPRWRGAAPVQAAIAAGDTHTGASIFRIERGLDTGPVIATNEETIGVGDTADDLLTRLTYSGRELLADALVALGEGSASFASQDDAHATHAAKISSADAQIDWRLPSAVIQRVARAHTPAPGAWTVLQDQRYKIGLMLPADYAAGASQVGGSSPSSVTIPDLQQLQPGQLLATKKGVWVGTATEALRIMYIQPPGKKMMAAVDWARGQEQLLDTQPVFASPVDTEPTVPYAHYPDSGHAGSRAAEAKSEAHKPAANEPAVKESAMKGTAENGQKQSSSTTEGKE